MQKKRLNNTVHKLSIEISQLQALWGQEELVNEEQSPMLCVL